MNQLQNLLNECLIETKHVENAAVINYKCSTVVAASTRFNIQPQQVQKFAEAFKQTKSIREEGLYFQDNNYTCVRADKNSIYSKSNDRGLILAKTGTYILVATYCEEMYPSVCVEAVEKLADYLREKGK
ncbi:profilin-4 [Acipenser oxyrinchus oxyrinchus]|uniref:Profilin n=1 Tax=Acipenser oxyrinchus oxyrinchus TaxID=40147 RepID=A0AAD8G9K2_ACIOX|nr:profilin-4 [Acipenser oxyrinchus oxyrinchus]